MTMNEQVKRLYMIFLHPNKSRVTNIWQETKRNVVHISIRFDYWWYEDETFALRPVEGQE